MNKTNFILLVSKTEQNEEEMNELNLLNEWMFRSHNWKWNTLNDLTNYLYKSQNPEATNRPIFRTLKYNKRLFFPPKHYIRFGLILLGRLRLYTLSPLWNVYRFVV